MNKSCFTILKPMTLVNTWKTLNNKGHLLFYDTFPIEPTLKPLTAAPPLLKKTDVILTFKKAVSVYRHFPDFFSPDLIWVFEIRLAFRSGNCTSFAFGCWVAGLDVAKQVSYEKMCHALLWCAVLSTEDYVVEWDHHTTHPQTKTNTHASVCPARKETNGLTLKKGPLYCAKVKVTQHTAWTACNPSSAHLTIVTQMGFIFAHLTHLTYLTSVTHSPVKQCAARNTPKKQFVIY